MADQSMNNHEVFVMGFSQGGMNDILVLCAHALGEQWTEEWDIQGAAKRIRYRAHLAYDRLHHPERAHPCDACRSGGGYEAVPLK